ncbi:MAG: TraR/DksA family transcriptional regulator [Actinomycetota bacterium]
MVKKTTKSKGAKKAKPKAAVRPASKTRPKAQPAVKPKRKASVKPKPKPAVKAKANPKPKPTPTPTPTPKAGPASTKASRPAKRVNFDKKTLSSIKKSLITQRAELTEQLEEIEEAAFSPSQTEAGGEVGFDEDYADAGTATFEREKDLSIANNISDLVDKIDKALEKISEGSYGLCENCGQPISADRLKALPHVLLCIKCKKAEERR